MADSPITFTSITFLHTRQKHAYLFPFCSSSHPAYSSFDNHNELNTQFPPGIFQGSVGEDKPRGSSNSGTEINSGVCASAREGIICACSEVTASCVSCVLSVTRATCTVCCGHGMKFQGVFKELGQFSHFPRRFKGLEQDLENSRRLKEIQGAYEPCMIYLPQHTDPTEAN